MKKLAIILLSALAVSCNNDAAPKPEHLLNEKEMENIFYDLTLLQSIKSSLPKVLDDNKVDVKNYIYKKYKIDSLTFAQNHTYYASDLEKYQKMQQKVSERLNKAKDSINPPVKNSKAVKAANIPPPNASGTPASR